MGKTLVQALQSVDRISGSVKVDKQALQVRLLEEARKHPLVDKAVRGDISIKSVIESLHQKYKGWRLFTPRIKDEQYDRKLDELNLDELLDAVAFRTDSSKILSQDNRFPHLALYLSWFYDKLANPVVLPVLMGGFTMLLIGGGKGPFESEIANYTAQFGVGVYVGLLGGLVATLMKYNQIAKSRKQAEYLDTKFQALRPYLN